jgi:hypothetical protein
MLRCGPLVLGALVVAGTARGQEVRRVQPTAFPTSVTASFGLGWGGKRSTAAASTGLCTGHFGCQFKQGQGPSVGLGIELPVASTLGVALGGTVGRPARVVCGESCTGSPDKVTTVHGALLLLWRFKARAPVDFGLGPAMTWMKRGVVELQTESEQEWGGAFVIGFDFTVTPTVGGRLAWWNYLTKPSDKQLVAGYVTSNLAWDRIFSLGVRLGLHK